MADYKAHDEATLRRLLEACTEYQERRKIRAAIRELQNFKTSTRQDGTRRIGREGLLERTGQPKLGHVRSTVDTKGLDNGNKPTKNVERRQELSSIRDAKHGKVCPRSSAVLSKPSDSDNSLSRNRTSGTLGTSTSKIDNSNNRLKRAPHIDQPMGLKSDMTSSQSTRLITTSHQGSRHSDTSVSRHSDMFKTHEIDCDTSNINRESNFTSFNNTSLSNDQNKVSRLEKGQKTVTKISDPYVMKSDPITKDPKVSRSSTSEPTSQRKTSFDVKSSNQKSNPVIIHRPSAVVRPFQSSTVNSVQRHPFLEDSKNQDKISESELDSCFIRNNSSRRTLPISNKVESHPSIEKKALKSKIRTSLPLVSLTSYSSPNFDYKPRPARRVSFEDESQSSITEDPQSTKSDLKTLLLPGVPKVLESRNYKDLKSEKELKDLLRETSDLNERKAIRFRIKEIRDGHITGIDVDQSSIIPVEEKVKCCLDYDKIEDEEQLKQLLKDTGDVDEKRKIRNSIRQVRRRSELEKVSAGSTSLRRSSSLTAPRRISESSIGRSTSVRYRPASPQTSSAGSISAELFTYTADTNPYKERENSKSAVVSGSDYLIPFIQESSIPLERNSHTVLKSETVSSANNEIRNRNEFSKNTSSPVKERKVGRVHAPNFSLSQVSESASDIGLDSSNQNTATAYLSGRKSINEDIVRQVKGDLNLWNQRESKYSSLNKTSDSNSGFLSEADSKKQGSVLSRASQHKEKFSFLKKQVRESLSNSSESSDRAHSREITDSSTTTTDLHSKTLLSEDAFKTDLLEKSRRESVTSSPNKATDIDSVVAVRKRSRIEMESKFSDILNDLDVTTSMEEINESDKPIENFVTNEKVNIINSTKSLISNNMDELNGNRVVSTLKPIIFNEPTTPMKSVEIQNEENSTSNDKKIEENNNTEMICTSIQSPVLQSIDEDKDLMVTQEPRNLKLDTDQVDAVDEGTEEKEQISPLVSDLQPRTFVNKRTLIRSKSLNLRPTSPTNCAINVERDDDGTIKVQQTSESNNRNRIVTITTRKYKTPSETDTEERDTVVETKFSSPGGSLVTERDEIHTKKRITSRGSNYYERSAMVTKRVKDNEGREIIQQDATDEKSNMSVTSGLTWGDRSTSRKFVSKAEPAPMLEDDTKKKSHATLVLNKLNVSKASSGYGSVSGSEEDELREETTEKPSGCPSIITPLKDITTPDGTSITLQCYVTGIPTPEIVWYLNNDPITDLSTYAITYDSETGRAVLVIEDVTKSSEGVFCCCLKNDVGEAETRCTLSVKNIPKHVPFFTEPLHDVKVSEGHSVTLTCRVTDAESVVWQKDGIVQKSTEDFKQSFDGEEAKLELDEVFLDDIGIYSCVARNDLGEESNSCKLKVSASSSTDTNVVPMFLTKLTNQTLNDGSSLIFECDVIGTPEPKIMWTHNGSSIPDYVNYSYDGRLAKLEIPVVTIKDSGRYEIVAENSCGRISMDSILSVQACQTRPTITQPMTNKTARSGDSVKLRCGVTGTPRPTISWRKNGMVIGQTKDFVQTYGNNNIAALEISDVCQQDSGNYEMIAKNSGGETSCTCQLIVEASSNQNEPHFNQSQSPFSQTNVQKPQSMFTHKPLQSNNLPPDPITPPSVSQLRMQFQVGGNQSNAPKSSSIRRWHSLPPQENKFSVYKGETRSQPQFNVRNNITSSITMSSYDSITNEDELNKLMNETESFDEKKKIRARIRGLHEEQRKDYEKKRLEHEKDTEKACRRQYEIADEEKARKMQSYASAGPTGERESQYSKSSDSRIKDAQKAADEDKQKKLESYSKIAESKTGGTTTTTTQKTSLSKTSTPMGMSYAKKPADPTAADLTNKILRNSGYGTSGQITVKTESWNSKDGLVEKSQKTESWGGGAKGAMNAFKQMDKSASPGGAKPNALATVTMAKKAVRNMQRNAVEIKEELKEFVKTNTNEYENVEVTNFSTSWNNGMAFCALIHHFYPDSFDFSKLDPKQRRANFNLAFDKAEELADIAPLLDVEDMVKMKNPDWKCVFTYVQSFYRKLRDHERNKAAPAKLPPTVEQ